MDHLVISLVALCASGLTLVSGFGLGTILVPVLAIFFPIDLAVALAAVVHLLNNLFKFVLLGRRADLPTLVRFGSAAVPFAFLGAWTLVALSGVTASWTYSLFGATHSVVPAKATVAVLMIAFAAFELLPRFRDVTFPAKFLPVGGALSGYFGGLSGNQGALRSAFLVRSGLAPEAFVATGVVIACVVDIARMAVYFAHFRATGIVAHVGLLAAVTGAAFLGSFAGARLVRKVTILFVQRLVSSLLFAIAVGLATGLL